MKRIFGIALAFFVLSAAPAFAVCPATLQVKDNAAVTANAKYSDDGSGNCVPNVVVFSAANPTGAATSANQSSQLTQETATASAAGTTADTAYSGSGSGTIVAILKWLGGLLGTLHTDLGTLNTTAQNPLAAQSNHTTNIGSVDIGQSTDGTTNGVRLTSQYPAGATAVQGSATGTTAATSTTLAATVSVTNYVCSISIRANATAAATGNATLSDGTKTFNFTQWTAPNASGLGVVEEIFTPCYPASAANTAWTLTSAAPGTGGVVSVAIAGYQK